MIDKKYRLATAILLIQLSFALTPSEISSFDRFQRITSNNNNLRTRHYATNNTVFGIIKDDFLLNDDTAGGARQQTPAIAINNAGRIITTWTDFRDGNADVYVQRIDSIGNFIGDNFRTNNDVGMTWQGNPAVAIHEHGNFIIAWEDRRILNSDVYIQRYNPTGAPIDTNFRVNDNVGFSDQRNTAVIIQPNQNFIVVWDDWRNDWGDIYAQKYDSLANPLGVNFRVNDDGNGSNQYVPSIGQDSLGNFVIVWMDGREGNWNVYAQRYNNQGQTIGTNFRVNDLNSDFQGYPEVSVEKNGRFIVVWEDQRNGNSDVYGQRFDASGNRIGVNFKCNDDIGTANQSGSDITIDNSGNFIVAWVDTRLGNTDIFAQRYNQSGNPLGSNFRVNNDATTQSQNTPTIEVNGQGNFSIAWEDNRQSNNDIYYQMYNSNGTPLGVNQKVNDDVASSHQRCSWITQGGLGNYVAVWEDERTNNTDIYGVKFDSAGNILQDNFRVNDDFSNSNQFYPSVAADFNNEFIVGWSDNRDNDYDIYAQRYTSTGIPINNNFKVNDDTIGAAQWYPVVSCDSIGNSVFVWIDYRSGNNDIYAQIYSSQGNPIGSNFCVNNPVSGDQLYASVAMDRQDFFVVTWMDNRDGNFDIFAQQYDNLGNPLGNNFKVNDDLGSSAQGYPSVTVDLNGNFSIVFEDERNSSTDIYMQRYYANGAPIGGNIRVNDDNTNSEQYSPSVSYAPNGKQVITWCDYRSGDDNPDIYTQAFTSSGSPLGTNKQINNPDLFHYNNQWLIGQGVVTNNSRIGFAWIDNRRHKGWDIYSKIVDWDFFTAISEESQEISTISNDVKIFPNPSIGKVHLLTESPITNDIEIFSITGVKVLQQPTHHSITGNEYLIDLSRFCTGIYFVKYEVQNVKKINKIILY